MNQIVNTKNCVRQETLPWLKGYLDGSVKATVLGKIKDAACIDIGTAKIFMTYVTAVRVFLLLDRVSGTLCLLDYMTETSHLYSLRDL